MTMVSKFRKNRKGFTLVEVIVVAVIVAVLALVAILLYQGYTKDARKNTAENLAAAAAGYLQAERNRGNTVTSSGDVTGPASIAVTEAAGVTETIFTVPTGSVVNITLPGANSNGVVYAVVKGEQSSNYNW